MANSEDRPEPQYAGAVFERIRETLDSLLYDDCIVAWQDDYVKPNYDLRADGAWLRPNDVVDFVNWSPACDLEEGPDSPDPLTTPALPFPFTARQFAAFMLDGWGWFLHQQFADADGRLDVETMHARLGGVRDAKPREALAEAFAALACARQHVGEPDSTLVQAHQAAQVAYDEAQQGAELLPDWREVGISEEECKARVERRKAVTAAAQVALANARKASEKDHAAWRRSMVRWLLSVPVRRLSREQSAAPSNKEPAGSASEAAASTRHLYRARAQENAILTKFRELGLDPMKVPRPKPGKSSPPVTTVRAALGYSTDVMQKAMARLRKDGRAAYCDTPAD